MRSTKIIAALTLSAFAGLALAQPASQPTNKPQPLPAKENPPKKPTNPSPAPQPMPGENDGGLLFAEPTIKFDKLEADFGVIFDDKPVDAEFKFTNTGGGPLIITNVQTSCGCTTPDWDRQKKQYEGGETGTIKVRFDPAHKTGHNTKTVTVETNDRSNPRIVLNIKTNITPLVLLEPNFVNFEGVNKGGNATKILKVTGRKPGFAVTEVSMSPGDIFSARVLTSKPVEVNGETLNQADIEIMLKPGSPVGRHNASLSIKTNEERAKPHSVGVNGEVKGDLTITPPQALLGVVAPGADFTSEIKIASRDAKRWTLKGTEIRSLNPDGSKPEMSITTTGSETGDVQTIKITGKAPSTPGARFNGELVITTDVPGEETLRARVLLTVRPAAGTASPETPAGSPSGAAPAKRTAPAKVDPRLVPKPTGIPTAPGTAPGGVPGAAPK
jgi:hypothetical protein